MLGFRLVNGAITIVPDEAVIVRKIFDLYLSGYGVQAIANTLNENGVKTEKHPVWHPSSIREILRNEKYMGDLLLQKSLRTDHLTKTQVPNTGQLPQYYVSNNHEPIISKEVFAAVQKESLRRAEQFPSKPGMPSAFTKKIRCSICGKNYRRKINSHNIVWCCSTYNTKGKQHCASKVIPEKTLKKAAADVLEIDCFDENEFYRRIARIDACLGNLLRFVFLDGTMREYAWQDRSRSESWTDELREQARQAATRRNGSCQKEQ